MRIAVLGVPWDASSSFLRGAAGGPSAILAALESPSTNMTGENGIDLGGHPGWRFDRHLEFDAEPDPVAAIHQAVGGLLAGAERVITLGGDHSIAYPVILAHVQRHPGLTVLQLDAHPDLYDEFEGDRLSHACPFARLLEQTDIRLVQAGIRSATGHQLHQAARFGVRMTRMGEWDPAVLDELRAPLYLSLDLDALDPAFAPGVSHHEPGGFTTRQVIDIIHRIAPMLVGADIVELNPDRDVNGMTAMVAGRLLREMLASMVTHP